MADETIKLSAESKEAQIAFLQLRDVVQEFLTQLGLIGPEAEKYGAKLTEEFNKAGVSARQLANDARILGKALEEDLKKSSEQAENLGDKTTASADKMAAFGAKIFAVTKVLKGAAEAVKAVAIATDSYSGATKDAIDETSNFLSALGSLDLPGASAALGQLVGQLSAYTQGINDSTLALGNLADAQKAAGFAKVIAEQKALIDTHNAQVAALDRTSAALVREIATQKESGEVQDFLKTKIRETLEAYLSKDAVVDEVLAREAASLGILTKAEKEHNDELVKRSLEFRKQEVLAIDKVVQSLQGSSAEREKSTERLIEAIKVVEDHGAVTEQESAKIQAAIAKEVASYEEYGKAVPGILQAVADKYGVVAEAQQKSIDLLRKTIDDLEAQAKKRQDSAGSGGGDPQIDATAQSVEKLKDEISDLEGKPIISPEEQNRLDEAKNSLADLNRTMQDYSRTVQHVADNHLLESEAFDQSQAQWEYGIELSKQAYDAQTRLLDSQDDGIDAVNDLAEANRRLDEILGDNVGTFQDLGGQADDVAGKMGDIADEAANIASESKKLDESDPLSSLQDGLTEALPIARELLGVIKEIVATAAQADI